MANVFGLSIISELDASQILLDGKQLEDMFVTNEDLAQYQTIIESRLQIGNATSNLNNYISVAQFNQAIASYPNNDTV